MSVTDIGSVWSQAPDPPNPDPNPVFTTNVSDGQSITLPFTWTASVDPEPTSVQFWADGTLQETVSADGSGVFEHELQLSAGSHELALCAWYDEVRICQTSAEFATVTISGTPDPPPTGDYTHRFATFNTTTDQITGTLNRFQPAFSWWVPGSPAGTPWPNGGGLFEVSTPHGPGIEIVQTPDMDYPSPNWDSHLGRFTAFHQTANFRGQTHSWKWSQMWPSAGTPNGWANAWLTGEGLTFATTNPSSQSTVGHHLYIHYANPMTFRFGRALYTTPSPTWNFTLANTFGVTWPADTWVHMQVDIKWTASADGFIRVYSWRDGQSPTQWVNFTGATLPTGWNVWTVYFNTRTVNTFESKITTRWANCRVLVS